MIPRSEETNLYYLNSRYYDPEIGRFLSADRPDYLEPESINGLNLYAYCNNNPVMYCDPEGTSTIVVGGAIFGVIAAIIAAMAAVAIIAVEVHLHAISNALNVLGNAIAHVFGNITDFLASLNNARNVTLPGLDYSGYVQWIFSKWEPGTWPGDDPTVAPGDDFEWKGKAGTPVGSPYGYWRIRKPVIDYILTFNINLLKVHIGDGIS